MAQLTNLNIAPYYDDYDEEDNFHKVLFRPGYSIQARELTTLQSILQNQIERFGAHVFKEGSVVIPGQVSYSSDYRSVRISETFADEKINLEQFLDYNNPVIITGETTGVQEKVIGYEDPDDTYPAFLYIQQIKAGNDGITESFANGENLSASIAIEHVSSYAADVNSLKTAVESNPLISCVQVGSSVTVEAGIRYVRGQFVKHSKKSITNLLLV
jgi:hypothetical protein